MTQPETPPVRWGLGDVALGIGLSLVATLALQIILVSTGAYDPDDDLSLTLLPLLQLPLWASYLGVTAWASGTKGNGVVTDFRLRMRWFDVPVGLAIGFGTQVLVGLLYLSLSDVIDIDELEEPARELTDKAVDPVGVILLVTMVVFFAPLVEELFFRGLLLRSLDRRWGRVAAIAGSALVFAVLHFQLLQFPALLLFGAVAAALAVRTGRLGPAIWAHVGFNATTVIALLAST